MLQSTKYRLEITAVSGYDLMANPRTDFQFLLMWDDAVLRQGTASSPEALGRAIGEAVRDAAEKYEQNFGR